MSRERQQLFRCVHCKRRLPRCQVVGYTHILEWTYICRKSIECGQTRAKASS